MIILLLYHSLAIFIELELLNQFYLGFEDPMMRLNTGLRDEPELDPSSNFSKSSSPSIRTELSPNVVGVLGKEVRLACYLNNLGNKTVCLISHIKVFRKSNLKILTNTYF